MDVGNNIGCFVAIIILAVFVIVVTSDTALALTIAGATLILQIAINVFFWVCDSKK